MPKVIKQTKQEKEVWIYGVAAIKALFATRPTEIRVILYTKERRLVLAPILRYAAKHRLPYREVDPEELVRVSGSLHHEGVCIRAPLPPQYSLQKFLAKKPTLLLALDGVGDPHNLGALFRSAAYFGVDGMILPAQDKQAHLSPAALRVSKGGSEWVPSLHTSSLPHAQVALKRAGIAIIGTDARASQSLFKTTLPSPCTIILGNESKGLSKATRSRCDLLVAIPGVSHMDSLNVSVSAGIILSKFFYAHSYTSKPQRKPKKLSQ